MKNIYIVLLFLGANIKFLRQLKGISQQKLAEAVELKRNNIASYESGAVEPRAINFLKIAHYFEVAPVDLLTVDLAKRPLEQLETKETGTAQNLQLLNTQLEEFITETSNMQKVVDGFRAFKTFKAQKGGTKQSTDDLIDILEHLLHANWKIIQDIQGT